MKNTNSQPGMFLDSLVRTNGRIREDRAGAIHEVACMVYRRRVEDLAFTLRKLERERDNLLDLSPGDAQSLVLAVDFDAEAYTTRDLELGVEIRNTEIRIELALKRFRQLFGEENPPVLLPATPATNTSKKGN